MLGDVFPSSSLSYAPGDRVRDRADLMWVNVNGEMKLGLFGLQEREIVDLPACPMMSEPLESWLLEFRKKAPPIVKGSVRLRVSPAGERGVWLDFANQDVKRLFDEPEYLKWLSERSFVEIGQRRKALVWREGRPKLTDPDLRPWFETYDADLRPIPLYGPVGGFSQPGFAANRALVSAVGDLVAASGVRDWLELFCGNGNFTLAVASRGHSVEAVEFDELALRGLEKSLEGKQWPVKIQRQDLYLRSGPEFGGRGLIVDPPRAGLREILTRMEGSGLPPAIIYVSCYTDVFLRDCEALVKLGYKPVQALGIDQFPFSPHTEWVGLLKL